MKKLIYLILVIWAVVAVTRNTRSMQPAVSLADPSSLPFQVIGPKPDVQLQEGQGPRTGLSLPPTLQRILAPLGRRLPARMSSLLDIGDRPTQQQALQEAGQQPVAPIALPEHQPELEKFLAAGLVAAQGQQAAQSAFEAMKAYGPQTFEAIKSHIPSVSSLSALMPSYEGITAWAPTYEGVAGYIGPVTEILTKHPRTAAVGTLLTVGAAILLYRHKQAQKAAAQQQETSEKEMVAEQIPPVAAEQPIAAGVTSPPVSPSRGDGEAVRP